MGWNWVASHLGDAWLAPVEFISFVSVFLVGMTAISKYGDNEIGPRILILALGFVLLGFIVPPVAALIAVVFCAIRIIGIAITNDFNWQIIPGLF